MRLIKRQQPDKQRFISQFLGIFEHFDIEIILLGIFQTEHPIGAGEGGSSGRFASKNGANCENAQGN
jgi:adenylosuccinate lyase